MSDIEPSCCHTSSLLPVLSDSVVDPVCGMTVDPKSAAGSLTHLGKTYYFCSTHCVTKFQADPERFLKPAGATPIHLAVPAAAGRYTCPMHPEIVQDGPGTCPKCGMALEPMQPSVDDGPDPELAVMQQRFWIGAALTVPVFLIAMAGLLPSARLMTFLHDHMAH